MVCVLVLYFNFVEERYKDWICKMFENNIVKYKNYFMIGFVGIFYLCYVLLDNDLYDFVGILFLKEDFLFWLYVVKKGVIMIWECWNFILFNGDFDILGMNFLNYYVYGFIGEWMYRKFVGINLIEVGYKKIFIKF